MVDIPPRGDPAQVVGAGRLSEEIIVSGDVALYCPTTGVDDPTTTWRRLVRDDRGKSSEERVPMEGRFSYEYVFI